MYMGQTNGQAPAQQTTNGQAAEPTPKPASKETKDNVLTQIFQEIGGWFDNLTYVGEDVTVSTAGDGLKISLQPPTTPAQQAQPPALPQMPAQFNKQALTIGALTLGGIALLWAATRR